MQVVSEIKKLCTPAFVYLVIAVLGLITIMLQNVGNVNKLCVGRVQCSVSTTTTGMFLVKALWIVFWTYILSTLCKYGHPNIAWFLVLFPFIVLFIALVSVADMNTGNQVVAQRATDDVLHQQQRDGANMNLRVQQGYFESGSHSGVKVYQL